MPTEKEYQDALDDFDQMERFIDMGVHPYMKQDFLKSKTWGVIRAALSREAVTVPVIDGLDDAVKSAITYPIVNELGFLCSADRDNVMKAARWVSENAGKDVSKTETATIPDGYALVPIEPTEEMLIGARDWSMRVNRCGVGNDQAIGCYKAMIDAAPKGGK